MEGSTLCEVLEPCDIDVGVVEVTGLVLTPEAAAGVVVGVEAGDVEVGSGGISSEVGAVLWCTCPLLTVGV